MTRLRAHFTVVATVLVFAACVGTFFAGRSGGGEAASFRSVAAQDLERTKLETAVEVPEPLALPQRPPKGR